jgi:hypothetical protein
MVRGNQILRALRHWFVGTGDYVLYATGSWKLEITRYATLVRGKGRLRAAR